MKHTVEIVIGAVTVVDNDGDLARKKAREEVALYLPVIAALDPTITIDQEISDGITKAVKGYDYKSAAEMIDDDLLSKFALAGHPDEIIHQCKQLIDAGTGRIEFGTPHGLDIQSGMDLLGREVLPALKDYNR